MMPKWSEELLRERSATVMLAYNFLHTLAPARGRYNWFEDQSIRYSLVELAENLVLHRLDDVVYLTDMEDVVSRVVFESPLIDTSFYGDVLSISTTQALFQHLQNFRSTMSHYSPDGNE